MKLVFRLFVVFILVIAAYVGGLAWPRFCRPVSQIEVYVNGKLQPNASAKKCPNGRILVEIPGESYVLIAPDFRAGSYPGNTFYNVFGLTFSHDLDPAGVSIDDKVKIDDNPGVEFSENSIGYSDLLSQDRILIKRTK